LVLNPSEMWTKFNLPELSSLKFFAINLPSQPFLGHHLGFYILFHNGLLGDLTLFAS